MFDLSKLKGFADDQSFVPQMLKFPYGSLENIVGKGENGGHHHFLLFSQDFQKPFFLRD